jgi:hypothetical protein
LLKNRRVIIVIIGLMMSFGRPAHPVSTATENSFLTFMSSLGSGPNCECKLPDSNFYPNFHACTAFASTTRGKQTPTCFHPAAVREFGVSCLEDAKYILTSPGEWGPTEWLGAALAVGTTLALYEADAHIRESWQKTRSDFGDDLFGLVGKAGHVGFLAPALGLWYCYGKRDGNVRTQEAARVALESLTVTAGLTAAVKLACHRSRPDTGDGPRSFGGVGGSLDDDKLSFCSLHSAAAFSVATVLADYYRDQHWTPVLAYGSATLVALSRINDDRHWSSDVFAGAVLGYYTAKKILARRSVQGATVTITPMITEQGWALTAQYRF